MMKIQKLTEKNGSLPTIKKTPYGLYISLVITKMVWDIASLFMFFIN